MLQQQDSSLKYITFQKNISNIYAFDQNNIPLALALKIINFLYLDTLDTCIRSYLSIVLLLCFIILAWQYCVQGYVCFIFNKTLTKVLHQQSKQSWNTGKKLLIRPEYEFHTTMRNTSHRDTVIIFSLLEILFTIFWRWLVVWMTTFKQTHQRCLLPWIIIIILLLFLFRLLRRWVWVLANSGQTTHLALAGR